MSSVATVARRVREWLRRWFRSLLGVPVLGVVAGVLLALATLAASIWIENVPPVATVEVAQQVLPVIGGATLTLAGFVLTIATLSLQFGATTYAPRLVEQLRRDRLLRHTLGGALGTFTYSIVVILMVRPEHEVAATLATVVALAGATTTVLLFIALLDRLTATLRPGRTMTRLTDDALRVIEATYPDPATAGPERGPDDLPDLSGVDWSALPPEGVVWRERGHGTLVDVDHDALVTLARERDLHVDLLVTTGTFLGSREAIAVLTHRPSGAPVEPDEELAEQVLSALYLGDERTVDADPSFPLRLLVDIALRALSPGVNDPTTAGQAMDHIEQVLLAASRRRLGARELVDPEHDDQVLLTMPAPGWPALLGLAWTEIWHFGSDPQTRRSSRGALHRLRERVAPARRQAIDELISSLESA